MLPQRILEQLHGAAWREEAGKGRLSDLLRGAREWNSESNHVIFGKLPHRERKEVGFIRRTRANAVHWWEGPMVKAWGAAWRMEVRAGRTQEEWRGGRDEFVKVVGKGVVG